MSCTKSCDFKDVRRRLGAILEPGQSQGTSEVYGHLVPIAVGNCRAPVDEANVLLVCNRFFSASKESLSSVPRLISHISHLIAISITNIILHYTIGPL